MVNWLAIEWRKDQARRVLQEEHEFYTNLICNANNCSINLSVQFVHVDYHLPASMRRTSSRHRDGCWTRPEDPS